MCNLYSIKVMRLEFLEHYDAIDDFRGELEKDYVSPGREGYVVRRIDGATHLGAMRWGFPPPHGVNRPVVNVRNYDSPFWRSTIQNTAYRCLVPVTRFQEWSAAPDPETGKKRAYWFSLKEQSIFSFAGIWRPTENGNVFAFLTCDPNPLVGAIHPKAMPVIVERDTYDHWLSGCDVHDVATPFPSQLMQVEN
jgi:putative SOS response-associated peptidase YedK